MATFVPQPHFRPCIDLLLAQRPIEADICIIQQSAAVEEECTWAEQQGCTVLRPGYNTGTCVAWNWGMRWATMRGYTATLLVGDDILLVDPRTLTVLRDVFLLYPRQLRYLHARGYSAIVVSRAITDEISEFDEGFWPAYFEDNDHHRRCILADIPWEEVLITTQHGSEGSATIKHDPEFNRLNGITFPLNEQRYYAKWGGGPGKETFALPWNGGPPWTGVREQVEPHVRNGIERRYAEILT